MMLRRFYLSENANGESSFSLFLSFLLPYLPPLFLATSKILNSL